MYIKRKGFRSGRTVTERRVKTTEISPPLRQRRSASRSCGPGKKEGVRRIRHVRWHVNMKRVNFNFMELIISLDTVVWHTLRLSVYISLNIHTLDVSFLLAVCYWFRQFDRLESKIVGFASYAGMLKQSFLSERLIL